MGRLQVSSCNSFQPLCRTAVNEEVDAYVERQFTKNKARASICFNEEGKLQVDISCISTNLGKFWTGEWQSQFLVDIQGQTMTGSVRINSHFWENGNVQFNLIKNFDETALAASDGVSIVAAIEKLETRYQSEVENVLENMKEGMFKKLRRVLPVTGQSYDWSGGKLAGM